MTEIKESSRFQLAGVVISISTVLGFLLAHGAVASYKSGYLLYFGVNINDIQFWPTIFDFMVAPIIFFAFWIVVTLIAPVWMIVINLLMRVLHKLAKKLNLKIIQRATSEKPFPKSIIIGTLAITSIIFAASLIYGQLTTSGHGVAEKQRDFTQLLGSEKPQFVIYQHDGQAVVKTYDPKTKKFTEPYEVVNIEGKSFKRTNLNDIKAE